jgi:hypothetical protein
LKAWHAIGLTLLALCVLQALLVSPLIPLFLAAALVGLLLSVRFPEVLAFCAIGVGTLLSQLQIIDLGIPSVGLNLLDFLVLLMVLVAVVRWIQIRDALSHQRMVQLTVCFLAAWGVLALLKGVFEDYSIRAAFRGFRFYTYVIVTFHFAPLISSFERLRRLAIGWLLLPLVQLYLLLTGTVVYHPENPGDLVFAPDISSTATHYIPIKTYFPMLMALGLLALAGRRLHLFPRVALWGLFGLQLVVLAFSYARSTYVGAFAGLVTIFLGTIAAEIHRRGRFFLVVSKPLRLAFLAAGVTVASVLIVGSFVDLRVRASVENVINRLAFANVLNSDEAILGRLEGFRIGLRDIGKDPVFGTGLGDSADPLRAQVFHNGWLWVAASAGLPALLAALLTLGLVCARTLATLGCEPESPVLSGLRLGLLASLIMWSASTLSWTSTMNLTDVLDWGLLVGLLAVLMPRKALIEQAKGCSALGGSVNSAA